MTVIDLAGSLAHPYKVSAGEIRGAGSRVDSGHRSLVVKQQTLVRGVKLGRAQLLKVSAAGRHESNRAVDFSGQLHVTLVGWVVGETLVPLVNRAQVGEATLGESTDEIQRRSRCVVGLQNALRVCGSRLLVEVVTVDDVAAVSRKGNSLSSLEIARARLGELAGHATHFDNRH